MSGLVELRRLRFEQQQLGYVLGELRTKLRHNNHHPGLIGVRARRLVRLRQVEQRMAELKADIAAQPLSRVDAVELVDKLTELEGVIVDQGYEGGLRHLRAFIDWVIADNERAAHIEAKEVTP